MKIKIDNFVKIEVANNEHVKQIIRVEEYMSFNTKINSYPEMKINIQGIT